VARIDSYLANVSNDFVAAGAVHLVPREHEHVVHLAACFVVHLPGCFALAPRQDEFFFERIEAKASTPDDRE
jgi:hypothetical protein